MPGASFVGPGYRSRLWFEIRSNVSASGRLTHSGIHYRRAFCFLYAGKRILLGDDAHRPTPRLRESYGSAPSPPWEGVFSEER